MNCEVQETEENISDARFSSKSPLRILVPTLAVLLGLLVYQSFRPTEYDEFIGQNFDYSGVSYTGKVINRESLRGSVVVVNFWATYCPFCLEDIEHLKELQQELRHHDFKILGITSDTRESLNDFFQARETLPWPSLYGSDAAILGKTYKVSTIPRVMLLDRDGTIIAVARGINDIKSLLLEMVYNG